MEINYKNLFISTVCIAALAGVGYAFYFDHKRRNNVAFRKELKKKKKAVEKEESKVKSKDAQASSEELSERIAALYKKISEEPTPKATSEAEAYLFHNLQQGEIYANKGPEYFEEAATYIFRAVRVCPNPVELVLMVQEMLPKPCYDFVIQLFSFEIKAKEKEYLEYYNEYPPSHMNVKFVLAPGQTLATPSEPIKKYLLIADKDFSEGDVIYTETPIVSSLIPSLEGKGFCSRCLIKISEDSTICKHAYMDSTYCSQACLQAVNDEFPSATPSNSDSSFMVFKDAKESNNMIPSLASRILYRVFQEHEKSLTSTSKDKYTSMQHIERFIGDELKTSAERLELETTLLQKYLSIQNEALDQVINLDYYKGIKSKILKGTFGIASSPEDPLVADCEIEEDIRFITPDAPTGCGIYIFSSYLTAGMFESNTQIEFRKRNYELSLVATKSIKKGDELIVATFKKPQRVTESSTTQEPSLTEANFPPLNSDSENVEVKDINDKDLPTYADVVAESVESQPSLQKADDETSELEPSETLEINEQADEQDSLASYSEIAADTPPQELSSSQEFDKLENANEE